MEESELHNIIFDVGVTHNTMSRESVLVLGLKGGSRRGSIVSNKGLERTFTKRMGLRKPSAPLSVSLAPSLFRVNYVWTLIHDKYQDNGVHR